MADKALISETMLALVAQRGPDKTICPSDVARAIGGDKPDGWSPLMQPVRQVAVALMKEGRVVITRKGRPVDPDDFKGVYRIRTAGSGGHGADPAEGDQGPGSSADV